MDYRTANVDAVDSDVVVFDDFSVKTVVLLMDVLYAEDNVAVDQVQCWW
jgi:hypothetical protein